MTKKLEEEISNPYLYKKHVDARRKMVGLPECNFSVLCLKICQNPPIIKDCRHFEECIKYKELVTF